MYSEESAENEEAGGNRVKDSQRVGIKLIAYMDNLLLQAEDEQTCRFQAEKLKKEIEMGKNPERINANAEPESTSSDESQESNITSKY